LEKSTLALTASTMAVASKAIPQNSTQKLPELQLRTLGRTGIQVSAIGFGASRIMETALLKMAIDMGINFIDTGRSYFNGQNEIMVGLAAKDCRQKLVIQSKLQMDFHRIIRTKDPAKKLMQQMESSIAASLKALQTDYIDILLIHGADEKGILENNTIQEFFTKAKKRGQIRGCGFSAHSNQVELLKFVNETGFYDVAMLAFNHHGAFRHSKSSRSGQWDQAALIEEMKTAAQKGIGLIAMKTCSGGKFSYNGEAASFMSGLKWILAHDFISTMAVAMENIKELEGNIEAAVRV